MVTGQAPENCTNFNYEILQFSGPLSGPESGGVRPDNVGDCKDLQYGDMAGSWFCCPVVVIQIVDST
jgi:hypothetical protein